MNFDDLKEITVLYVEDEDILRDNIADMLQDVCKCVFTASNGEEGYKLFLEKESIHVFKRIYLLSSLLFKQ